jgi:hypothetical protein
MKTTTPASAAMILLAAMVESSVLQSARAAAQPATEEERRKEIDGFNTRFLEAHRTMEDAAILGTWGEDGVNLLPRTAPMVGKTAITNS